MSSPSPLVAIFSVLSSSCSSIAFWLSFVGSSLAAAASLCPVVLLPSSSCLSFVLSSSSPLVLLLACPLMLSCCPLGVVRSLGVFVLLSFPHPFVLRCPPYVLLWSFRCPTVYVAFRGRGSGCGRPPQQYFLPTRVFGVYAGRIRRCFLGFCEPRIEDTMIDDWSDLHVLRGASHKAYVCILYIYIYIYVCVSTPGQRVSFHRFTRFHPPNLSQGGKASGDEPCPTKLSRWRGSTKGRFGVYLPYNFCTSCSTLGLFSWWFHDTSPRPTLSPAAAPPF